MRNLNDLMNFEHIIEKNEIFTDNRLIEIYVNIFENLITFEIKACYILLPLKPENLKLLGRKEKYIKKIKMVSYYLIYKMLEKFQCTVTLLAMVI